MTTSRHPKAEVKASARTKAQALLLVLSGPSGVGKDSILRGAGEYFPELSRSISVTTRPPRPGEQEGREYFFRSEEEFQQLLAKGGLWEWARYLDYHYGTPRAWVEEALTAGRDVVLEIDVQGARQIRRQFPEAVLIFVAPPSRQELVRRLRGRNTETEASIAKRLRAYEEELAHLPEFDYLIINDQLEEAVERFRSIVVAEKSRVRRLNLSALEQENG